MAQLPPILCDEAKSLLGHKELIVSLVDTFGSPTHLLLPKEFQRNISRFQEIFLQHNIRGHIWYACKANKAETFLEMVAASGIGVEVSSLQELRMALGHGIMGYRIGVSGPFKTPQFLLLAVQHQCTIVLDSLEELDTLVQIVRFVNNGSKVDVIARVSGFEVSRRNRNESTPRYVENGRFGIAKNQIDLLYTRLGEANTQACIQLVGFGFHIDNHSVRDRREATEYLIDEIKRARSLGFASCRMIDIGGGYSVQYIRPDDWRRFMEEYQASLINQQDSIMFRGKSFGLILQDGRRSNRGNFYPYVTEAYKEEFLNMVLSTDVEHGYHTISSQLREQGIEIIIEPGKALLDQSGMTLCRIKGIRSSTGGDSLLVCDMNISNLFEQMIGSEFAVDPILICQPNNGTDRLSKGPFHITGNLCLESDMLAWRRVEFNTTPMAGDILAFVNTAGYQMDFIESRMHQLPLPQKIALYKARGQWIYQPDNSFSSLKLSAGC